MGMVFLPNRFGETGSLCLSLCVCKVYRCQVIIAAAVISQNTQIHSQLQKKLVKVQIKNKDDDDDNSSGDVVVDDDDDVDEKRGQS